MLLLVLGVLVVAVGLGIGALTIATRHYESNVTRVTGAFPPSAGRPSTAPQAAGSVTFLMTAVEPDSTARTGLLADSVMLVRLTADQDHVQVVYLPVNLWVTPSGQDAGTLGGIFRSGGPSRVIGAVESVSGVRVDHYAQLDFAGFRKVIDAVGGIDVTVPEPYSSHGYSFVVGPRHMDGAEALAYVRAETTAAHAGDAAREQLIITALFSRLGTIGALSDLGTMTDVVGSVSKALSVDAALGDPQLVRLAWDHRGVGSPDVVIPTLRGRGVKDGEAVVSPEAAQLQKLWEYLRADDLAAHLGEFY